MFYHKTMELHKVVAPGNGMCFYPWRRRRLLPSSSSEEDDGFQIANFAERSFGDAFEGSINGDLVLVQVSFMVVFIFLGATLGQTFSCRRTGSRCTSAQAGVVLVMLSALGSIGVASMAGLFYGPVHSSLPFVLVGIGVDDAFVTANAFGRERTVPRRQETNLEIATRSTRALAKAGGDVGDRFVGVSSTLPALARFCAYASIGVFFLWFLSSTLIAAVLVLDERRQ